MEVVGHTANQLYTELWWRMKVSGVEQKSRNGAVISIPEPVMFTLYDPTKRVLTYPVRDANPFFHVAEVVWMFAGSNQSAFVEMFNRRYREYADDGVVWGAYGHRWIRAFDIDQIQLVIERFHRNLDDRQCVIGMWNPFFDLVSEPPKKDRPCNTQIMFRVVDGHLDMLVTNRSNDLVWGAMGANVVHFTYLQEVVARSIGMNLGKYRVVTNNLHVYPGMPRYEEIRNEALLGAEEFEPEPLTHTILSRGESWGQLHEDCWMIVTNVMRGVYPGNDDLYTLWAKRVALPMIKAYLEGPGQRRTELIESIKDPAWKGEAEAWWKRRQK